MWSSLGSHRASTAPSARDVCSDSWEHRGCKLSNEFSWTRPVLLFPPSATDVLHPVRCLWKFARGNGIFREKATELEAEITTAPLSPFPTRASSPQFLRSCFQGSQLTGKFPQGLSRESPRQKGKEIHVHVPWAFSTFPPLPCPLSCLHFRPGALPRHVAGLTAPQRKLQAINQLQIKY